MEDLGGSVAAGPGIVSSCHQLDLNDFLGNQSGTWHYLSHGCVRHNSRQVKNGLLTFGNGDVVTLKLDLSSNAISDDGKSGGTLSAYTNGKSWNEIILFDNIVGNGHAIGMDFGNGDGFYPTIGGFNGCRAKFVRFEGVE